MPFDLTDEYQSIASLRPFNGSTGQKVKIPPKKGQNTYLYKWNVGDFGNLTEIEIKSIIEGTVCGKGDKFADFQNCDVNYLN